MRLLSILLIAAGVTACTTAPQPEQRSAKAHAELQRLLAGKSPGQPISCLQPYRSDQMVVIDDNTVAFRAGGKRVYVNNFQGGGCNSLGSGFYTLVTKSYGGMGLCRGDIAQVADLNSGMIVGSCVIGDFVPYTRS